MGRRTGNCLSRDSSRLGWGMGRSWCVGQFNNARWSWGACLRWGLRPGWSMGWRRGMRRSWSTCLRRGVSLGRRAGICRNLNLAGGCRCFGWSGCVCRTLFGVCCRSGMGWRLSAGGC